MIVPFLFALFCSDLQPIQTDIEPMRSSCKQINNNITNDELRKSFTEEKKIAQNFREQ